jgi:hypothetical protein
MAYLLSNFFESLLRDLFVWTLAAGVPGPNDASANPYRRNSASAMTAASYRDSDPTGALQKFVIAVWNRAAGTAGECRAGVPSDAALTHYVHCGSKMPRLAFCSRRECPAQMTAPAPGVPHHAWF